jgi:hypothetical protein
MATLSFETTFDITTKTFLAEDTSDYAGQGIALTDVNGCFTITSPSGVVIYNNVDFSNANCDIYIDNALTSQQTVNLPLDGTGAVEAGTYTVLYTVYDTNLLTYSTVTNTYTFAYTTPTVAITQTIDCVSPLFTSVDATNYVVNSITPSITRVHSIYYPVGSGGVTTTGSTTTVTSSTFYNGTQTTEIESTLSYVFTDGLIVTDIIEGVKEVIVDCTWVCSIYCCIKALEARVQEYSHTNRVEYEKSKALFSQVMALVGLAKLAIECGKSADVDGYLASIRSLTECTEDCSCDGDEPALVTGLGGLVNEVVVQAGSANVTVTPVTVGNTTTYTINLGAAFVSLVNSLYNSVVAAGDNITVTPVTVGITTTYTVAGKEAIVAAGYGVTSTPVTVGNDTTYTVAVGLTNGIDSTNTAEVFAGVAPYSLELPIQVGVLAGGTYLALFEADVDATATGPTLEFDYYFMKTGVFTPIGTAPTRYFFGKDDNVYKATLNQILTLAPGDTVSVGLDIASYAVGHEVSNSSITLIRLA